MSAFDFCFNSLTLADFKLEVLKKWSQTSNPSIFQSEIEHLNVDVLSFRGFRVMAVDANGQYMDEREVRHNYDALSGFVVEGVINDTEFSYISESPFRAKSEKIATYLTISLMKKS